MNPIGGPPFAIGLMRHSKASCDPPPNKTRIKLFSSHHVDHFGLGSPTLGCLSHMEVKKTHSLNQKKRRSWSNVMYC